MEKEELNTPEMLRRVRLDLNTPAELAIFNAMQEVEKAGADVRLTEATTLLAKAKDCVADFIDGVEHPLPPAEGAELDHQHDHLLDHPEGAEEILEKHMKLSSIQPINGGYPLHVVKIAMQEFATLHAQRIANKMVSERLREELIKFLKWDLGSGYGGMTDEEIIDEYLKIREK